MADDSEIQIKVTADTSDATSNISDAASQVQSSLEQVGSAGTEAGEALDKGIGGGAEAAIGHLNEMHDSAMNVGEGLSSLKGMLMGGFETLGITAAIEGFNKLSEAVAQAADRAVELTHMSEIVGATTVEMQGLNAVAAQAGVSQEELQMALMRLDQEMEQAREGSTDMAAKLQAVGITAQDVASPTFTAADALYALAKSGASSGELMELLSRRGVEVSAIFPRIAGGASAVTQIAKNLNAQLQNQTQSFNDLHAQLSALDTAYQNSTDKTLAFWGGVAVGWKTAWDKIKADTLNIGTGIAEGLDLVLDPVLRTMDGLLAELGAVVSGHFKDMGKIAKETWQGIVTEEKTDVAQMRELWSQLGAENTAISNAAAGAQGAKVPDTREGGGGGAMSAGLSFDPTQALASIQKMEDELNKLAPTAQKADQEMAASYAQGLKESETDLKAFTATVTAQLMGQQQQYAAICKNITASYTKAGNTISSALDKAFEDMATKGKSFSQVMGSMLQQLEMNFAKMCIQNTVHWVAMQAAHLAEQQAAQAQGLALAASGAAQGQAIQAATGQKNILVDAKQAAAGAYQATAGIPYIGPVLAPAAAAAAFAATAAFASFDQGGLVSDDMMANVHKNEMVLPRHISEGLQSAIGGGGLKGSGGDTHNYHIMAMDAGSLQSFLKKSGSKSAFSKMAQQHVRNRR